MNSNSKNRKFYYERNRCYTNAALYAPQSVCAIQCEPVNTRVYVCMCICCKWKRANLN